MSEKNITSLRALIGEGGIKNISVDGNDVTSYVKDFRFSAGEGKKTTVALEMHFADADVTVEPHIAALYEHTVKVEEKKPSILYRLQRAYTEGREAFLRPF